MKSVTAIKNRLLSIFVSNIVKCFLISIIFLLIGFVLSGVFSPVYADEEAELHFTVLLAEEDITLAAQIMIMKMPPITLEAKAEKIVTIQEGTYTIMTMFEHEEIQVLPSQKQVTVEAGEVKNITIELEAMPGVGEIMEMLKDLPGMEEGMPDMSGITDEESFDPEKATDEELKDILKDEEADKEIRRLAFEELDQRSGIPFMIKMLGQSEDEIRLWSLQGLHRRSLREKGESEVEKAGVIPDIIPFLKDPNPEAKIIASNIIGNCWTFPEAALTTLIEGFNEPNPEVRASFVRALGSGRARAVEAVQPLAKLAREDNSSIVRKDAIEALGRIGKSNSEVLDSLQLALGDNDAELRLAAVKTLGSLEGFYEERAVIVADALQDEELDVRRNAGSVLSRLDEAVAKVITQLIEALNDPDSIVRIRVLASMQNLDGDTLGVIIDSVAEILLKDEDPDVREEAGKVILEAGPVAASVLPALDTALSDEESSVVVTVAVILLELVPEEVNRAIPRLVEILATEDPATGRQVGVILNDIGEPAVNPLMELLDRDSVEAKSRSATVLGWIGSPAEPAVSRLKALFRDENEEDIVRRDAYRAITNITGERPEL